MNKSRRSISLVLVTTVYAVMGSAQQVSNRKPVPSLSSDGVMVSRSINSSAVAWTRYTPEGFGVSFELPGDPVERPYPVPPELQSRIKGAKVFDYIDERIVVSIGHLIFSKRMELKQFAENVRNSLYRSGNFQNLKISLVPNGDKVLMRGSFNIDGREAELNGFFLESGEEIWLVSAQTIKEHREMDAIRSRILESIRRNP